MRVMWKIWILTYKDNGEEEPELDPTYDDLIHKICNVVKENPQLKKKKVYIR